MSTLNEKDKKYLARDSDAERLEIVGSEDSFIYTHDGKKYIDFYSGWCVGNIGWNNNEIKDELKKFNGPDYVSPSLLYEPWAELAELLAKITPGKLTKSFRATGGTEAIEIALRTANAYTKRKKFISIEGSYHGDSIGAMSIGSSEFRKNQNLLFKDYKIKPPLNEKALERVEKFLMHEDVAALIMEPIICNLAVYIPTDEFMKQIHGLCKKYGTLLIIDEVATGFGRTGKLFGAEHFNLEPDIMCMAKAITGGFGPMGATITTAEIAKAMEFESSYYSTYGWYPQSVAAALLTINYILRNKEKLEKNTEALSNYFSQRLNAMKFEGGAKIRIKGLAMGLTFKKQNYGHEMVKRARKKGLLISAHNEQEFTMFPALTLTQEVAKEGLDILESCAKMRE